jgi:hypothetical protein
VEVQVDLEEVVDLVRSYDVSKLSRLSNCRLGLLETKM